MTRKAAMTQNDLIRMTAEGMIRNYGNDAAGQATSMAKRHVQPTDEGQKLWLAVAEEIRALQLEPAGSRL